MNKLILLLCIASASCDNRICIKAHTETRHSAEWTQFIPQTIGDITIYIPIEHPAYDYNVQVCDEYAAEKPISE